MPLIYKQSRGNTQKRDTTKHRLGQLQEPKKLNKKTKKLKKNSLILAPDLATVVTFPPGAGEN